MGKPKTTKAVEITAPKMETVMIRIKGTSPYVQNKFSQKAKNTIHEKQASGLRAKVGGKKEAKDFEQAFKDATYITEDNKNGIPATAFRNAMISACRLVADGIPMTRAKMAFWVEPDGFDTQDMTPLVYFKKGEPKYYEASVRLATGVCDLRARPMWKPGWEAEVRITFDSEMLSSTDIANLLMRAGVQVGVGEGRNDSKKSCGMGFGSFDIVN